MCLDCISQLMMIVYILYFVNKSYENNKISDPLCHIPLLLSENI